jgi:hypothetical protein
MKVTILYHPKSDHASNVESFARDFSKQTGRSLELISVDSREGARLAELYDAVQYPAILAMDDTEQILRMWQGPILPLINEVSYYTQDA